MLNNDRIMAERIKALGTPAACQPDPAAGSGARAESPAAVKRCPLLALAAKQAAPRMRLGET